MRKCYYGILATVFLCTWKAEETFANRAYLKHIKKLFLLHDADWLYGDLCVRIDWDFFRKAEEYASNHSSEILDENHIVKQYMFMSFFRKQSSLNNSEITRSFIMLNAYLTFEAYEAAVIFRVCAFYYSHVIKVEEKEKACMHLSLYMEWYFSFKLKEKADDLCTIKQYFTEEENISSGLLKAENICEILKKLNLNFLKFPEEEKLIPVLQYDDNNVFNPRVLGKNDENGERYFTSIFELFQMPQVLENQTRDQYYKLVFDQLWHFIMVAYTDNYRKLSRYFSEVSEGLPNIATMMLPSTSKKIMWDNALHFDKIRTLSTETRRGVIWYIDKENIGSNLGSIMYRSNAIEILRQISYLFIFPKSASRGLNMYEIMKSVNSGGRKCFLESAKVQQNLSVDYVFRINNEDFMPLLPRN